MEKLIIVVLMTMVACNGRTRQNATLDAANQVHLEAIEVYTQVHHLYDSLKKEARDKGDSVLVIRLDSIHDIMHGWEDGLYEVPGYEHSHVDHSHGHQHTHRSAPKMTDESMLDYQKMARQAISDIRNDLEKMINR